MYVVLSVKNGAPMPTRTVSGPFAAQQCFASIVLKPNHPESMLISIVHFMITQVMDMFVSFFCLY